MKKEAARDLGWIDRVEYGILRTAFPEERRNRSPNPYENRSKVNVLLGPRLLERIQGKVVVDFGCGEGRQAIDLVRAGARRVVGVDRRKSCIDASTRAAREAGLSDRCFFTTDPRQVEADAIVSLDGFEHFEDPAAILDIMFDMLPPGGFVATSFGPTWYHPMGGHLFSVFPWAHLLFTERALVTWRSHIRDDGAKAFGEVSGGLNQMTIQRFEECVAQSKFEVEFFEPVPIRKLRWLHTGLTREFTTSVVRCELRKPIKARRREAAPQPRSASRARTPSFAS